MRQTSLDEFNKHVCSRCGRNFKNERALKSHIAAHKQKDFFTVVRALDKLRSIGEINQKQMITLLKAIRYGYNNPQRAIEILSCDKEFENLVEALKYHGAEWWVKVLSDLIENYLSIDEIDGIIRDYEAEILNKNKIYIT